MTADKLALSSPTEVIDPLPFTYTYRLHILINWEYQKDQNKKKHFSDSQGQLTLQAVDGSGEISNSFEILCMSSIYARIK